MRGNSFADLSEMPYSSVQQREYFVSAHMGSKDMGGNFPSTPDLVHSLNQLQHASLPPIESALKYTYKDTSKSAKRRSCLPIQQLPFALLTRCFAGSLAPEPDRPKDAPSFTGEHGGNRHTKGGGGTRRSAIEWMTDSSRTERLEKLNQQLPLALKTKVRLGDVKASDASRDVAEAKSECAYASALEASRLCCSS